jgi:hypothetical protein
MKKYLVLYHATMTPEMMQQMMSRPKEDMAKGMEAWAQWAQKCGNHLVDMGSPLMGGQALNADGTSKNSEKNVGGYSILQAENMDEAKALLHGHPHLGSWNPTASIEVHEFMPMPGM